MRFRHRTARPLLLAAAFMLVVGAALVGCATIGGANYVSLEEEWQLGRELEADINRQVTLVNDPTLQRYVEQMGQRIVRETEMAGLSWRFHVIADDAINAFNIPGGAVYVNTGLIAQAGSASELAGAVAHEVAHGVARHGTQRLSQAYEANLLAGVLLGNNPGLVEQLAAQVVAQGAFASFSRSDEREADRMAIPYMAGAGWDPEGLARMFERLMAESGGGSVPFFSTHPTTQERIENVRALAQGYDGRTNDGQFSSIRSRAARY
ncbi:MAG: M48 family metallopeptidase [Rubricoccaceae bacterium]|nr:M48 family metallopeptidase [Rubricoccaceae bacterium]